MCVCVCGGGVNFQWKNSFSYSTTTTTATNSTISTATTNTSENNNTNDDNNNNNVAMLSKILVAKLVKHIIYSHWNTPRVHLWYVYSPNSVSLITQSIDTDVHPHLKTATTVIPETCRFWLQNKIPLQNEEHTAGTAKTGKITQSALQMSVLLLMKISYP